MSDTIETLKLTFSLFLDDLMNGGVPFSELMSTASVVASLVNDEQDLDFIAQELCSHEHMQMRRLASLAFTCLHFRFKDQVLPWVEKGLEDDCKWVQFDSIRYFFNNALLEAKTFQLLEDKRVASDDEDVKKMATHTIEALTELQSSYSDCQFKTIEFKSLTFKIPASWQNTRQSEEGVIYQAPEIESFKTSRNKITSSFRVQIVPELSEKEVRKMNTLNINLVKAMSPAWIKPFDKKATRFHFHDSYTFSPFPDATIRDHKLFPDQFVVATVKSPLAHYDQAKARNCEILDSMSIRS